MRVEENRPAEIRAARALARPPVRQVMNLSVAVAGTLGGAVLFSSNLAVMMLAQVGSIPWAPLSANLALVFGGVMFAREYRLRARESAEPVVRRVPG